jgi:DNA-binding winged helix-turn-helix (wHTH) protein/tetratricopeptide (TPR) repeat protein
MGTRQYRFGRFRLNPQARELFDGDERVTLPVSTIDSLIYLIEHRDRPVGRDELAAAVWGRADISEVSLSHAVMRLRKQLGDTGNEQRAIRTVPRLGYRWVMEGTIEEEVDATPVPRTPIEAPIASANEIARAVESPRSLAKTRLAIFAAIAIVAVVALAFLLRPPSNDRIEPPPRGAIVLPATIDASPDAVWIRLGLMDLVASRLRRGGIATTPSETVVALANRKDGADAFDRTAFPETLIVRPNATAARGQWTVRLDASVAAREVRVETTAADPIDAGRKAADELLIKLGHSPPASDDSDASTAQATLRQRVTAAVLSGQLDVARDLIRSAPPALKASPEIALSEAKIEFFGGNTAQAREKIEALLASLPADASTALRGRALNTLGASYFREGRLDDAGRAYAESIRLVERDNRPDVLANAYIGSGGIASQRLRLDEAAADYGRARTLLELGNDAFGVAAVDLNLGIIALQRGQPAAALPTLRNAAARFEKLASEDALAASLTAIVDADLALLDAADAIATTDRLAALQTRSGNGRERWDFALARARALAGAGRLAEADALLARLADASDPGQDAVSRSRGNLLGAEIALARGDCAHGAELAAAAMTPTLDKAVPIDFARASRLRVESLACAEQTADAIAALGAFETWATSAPAPAIGIELLRARAVGARDVALPAWAAAMTAASERAIPDEIADVGLESVRALLAAGRVDDAVSVNGRTAAWADRDARAALIQALVYSALGQAAAADDAFERARRLAGERVFADLKPRGNRTAGP